MNAVRWLMDRLRLNQNPAPNPPVHNSSSGSNDDPDKEEVRRRQGELERRLARLRIEAAVRAGRRIRPIE